MDQPARTEIAIQPKTIAPTPVSSKTSQNAGPRNGGTVLTWNKDTGEEVLLPEKRKQTRDEAQRILKTRQVGACDECRAAKKKVDLHG